MMSFTCSHRSLQACLKASTSTPFRSSISPIRLFSPFIKAKKSSTSRARRTIAAMMASIFTLWAVSSDLTFFRKLTIFPALMARKTAPTVIAMSFSSLSVPPSLSASHSNRVLIRCAKVMAVSDSFTIALAIEFVTPKVLSMSASHKPHVLRMFLMASVTVRFTLAYAASISSADSKKASFRSLTLIVPLDAISRS